MTRDEETRMDSTADLLRHAAGQLEDPGAVVGPQIASPLAAWLRASADAAEAAIEGWADAGVPADRIHRLDVAAWDRPVAVARAILGETS